MNHRPDTRPRRQRAAGAAALAVAVAVAAASCGVPLDEEPRAITRTTLAPESTPTTIASAEGPSVSVYFLEGDRLQAQQYTVKDGPTLGQAIGLALQSPAKGSPASLRTAVPPNTELRSAEVDAGTARIDLTGEINDVSGQTQKEAFAQLVFTALSIPGVRQVRFRIDGKDVDAPTDDGNQTLVSAKDYKAPLSPR